MSGLIDVPTLRRQREAGEALQLVDVRSASEYATGHIPGAVSMPLEQIESRLQDLGPEPIVLICKGGKRARMAAGLLEPCRTDLVVLTGGTDEWIAAGLPVVTSLTTRWSLERQVRLAAGLIVLTGVVLGLAVDVWWFGLSAFVGLGLTFSGLTDICPMGVLLVAMPWNGAHQCGKSSEDLQGSGCS